MGDFIYILPAVVTLFWVIRIFFKKDAVRTQLFVGAGMLMATVSLFYRNDTVSLVFPFLYLAVKCKTCPGGTNRFDWILFLPSILFLPYNQTLAFYIYTGVQVLAVSVWSIARVRTYNRLVAEYYVDRDSSSENLGEILAYVVASVLVMSVLVLVNDGEVLTQWIRLGLVTFVCVLQYMIGLRAFNISSDYDVSHDAEFADEESDVPVLEPAVISSDARLLQRVIDEKMYLDPMLSLVSLAAALKTNRTYLSASIHSCYNQNFSDFINTLRIRYALELMENSGKDVNIKDVAMQSGYNHVQSFYRHFSEIMEMTSRTWLSRQVSQ